MRFTSRTALVVAMLPAALRADVTIRYKHDWKQASGLGAVAVPTALMPQMTVIRVKGGKAYTDLGVFVSILDAASGQITVIDKAHKTFAMASFEDYLKQIGEAMPSKNQPEEMQRTLASMKTSVSSRKTGRMDVIQGVQAEETEITLSIDMAMPGQALQAGPLMTTVMQFWTARPEEAAGNAALHQLAQFRDFGTYFGNPIDSLPRILALMPGAGQALISVFRELSKNSSAMLRFHMSAFMPMLAHLAQQTAQQGRPLLPGFDPNAPLMEMNTEVAEISTTAIDDSVFGIPTGFQAAPLGDLMKALTAAARPTASVAAPRR